MIRIKIKYDDSKALAYLKRAERKLQNGSRSVISRIGSLAKARAIYAAPFKDGYLRGSIIKRTVMDTPSEKIVKITTREDPKPERRDSFGEGDWATFVNWLHNSNYAKNLNWHGRIPDFLTNDALYSDLEPTFKTMIIQVINQSYEVK